MPDAPEDHVWDVVSDHPNLTVTLRNSMTHATAASISTRIPVVDEPAELAMYVASVASRVLEKYQLVRDTGDLLQISINAW